MKIGIYGYGNLARGVECASQRADDITLAAVFSRRDPASVKTLTGVPVFPAADVLRFKDELDVLMICGGSATDLPKMTPTLARDFNVVDSFDTHADIPQHFDAVDAAARAGGKTALISGGWDPGMFSLARVYASAILPGSKSYTFWGRGVSQGHSDAVRRIPGVLDARQYTLPVPAALEAVRAGEQPELSTREKHTRECYVVAEPGADLTAIKRAIKTMPKYFDEYDTTVTFITEEEMRRDHSALPHGGSVITSGVTGLSDENKQVIEYRLALDSNPEFTGSVLVALARAVGRMNARGDVGCKTVLDVPPAMLSPLSAEELRRKML